MRILLIFIIIVISAVSVFIYLGVPNREMGGHHGQALQSAARAPAPVPAPDNAAAGLQAQGPEPRLESRHPEAEIRGTASTGSGSSFRGPLLIANLVKCKNLAEVVAKYARQYGVDEDLVWAVIRQESGFNPGAVSPKGAMGLMQLMPGTAALLGVSDPFDVEQNVAGGVKYLEQCLNQFHQDIPLALAAYNAGPANVVKYHGCPPFAETRTYVASILAAYAGESIQENWKLCRVHYVVDADPILSAPPTGLPWRIPLPSWKIATPQCKLGSPHWKATVRPF